jgi:hypothetical protein
MTTGKKVLTYGIIIAVLVIGSLAYYHYFFVLGEGVKSGELNYVVKKGYLFKTYEGKLIQSGIQSKQIGTLQSNEFEFSIADQKLAEQLMANSGKVYQLHYKEYNSSLPWRGFSVFVVDSVVSFQNAPQL